MAKKNTKPIAKAFSGIQDRYKKLLKAFPSAAREKIMAKHSLLE